MSSEEEASAPDPSQQTRAMQELLPYLHDLVGDTAEITTEDYWSCERDGSVQGTPRCCCRRPRHRDNGTWEVQGRRDVVGRVSSTYRVR
jgi:hypothetical protein